MKMEFVLQFAGIDKTEADLVNSVKETWKNSGGSEADIKKISLYVQPDNRKTYFVINDSDNMKGAFDM